MQIEDPANKYKLRPGPWNTNWDWGQDWETQIPYLIYFLSSIKRFRGGNGFPKRSVKNLEKLFSAIADYEEKFRF